MIFKTWLTGLNDVQKAINNISTLSTTANGATHLFSNSAVVQQYASALNGLNKEQVLLALSYKNLSTQQKEQILAQMGLIASENTIQSELLQTTLAQKGVSAEKSKAILVELGLMNAETGEVLSQKACTKADLEAILAQKGITGAQAEGIISALGLGGANAGLTASFELLRKAILGATTALLSNPMTWVVAGLAGVVTVAYQCSQAIEEVGTKAQELNETFSTSKTEIEDYKTQIDDLYKVINDSGSSIEDVTTARQNLMTIQDQLIEKFGDEKDTIDLITDAINGQTDALNTLTEAQWQAVKNEFNESGFWNNVANGIDGYSNNIDRMLGEYEGYSVTIDMSEYGGTLFTEGYDEFKQMLMDDFGATISKSSTAALELSGSASEVRQKLLDIQEVLKENNTYKPDDTFSDYLGGLERSADDVIEKYEDFYKQYVLYEEIFTNDTFTDSYKKINDAYSEYQDAFATGDEESIKKAQDNFASILTQATEGVSDESVVDFFNDMYPDLQEVVGNWKFETNFTANTDGLKNDVSSYLSGLSGLYSYDLHNFNYDTATEEQKSSYDGLISVARLYGLTIDQLIDKLVLMGLVQDEEYQRLVDKFGKENVAKIAPEDLTFAYQIKNVGDMSFEEFQAEIQRLKDEATNPDKTDNLKLFDQLTSSKESLDKFQSSVQSAYDSYAKLMNPNISSSDILSSIQSITSAVSDMDGSLNWEFIASQSNSLELLGGAIDYITEKYAKSVLSGAGIDVDSKFGQMLANNIIQAQKASIELENLNGNIDSLQSAYNDLTDIIDTYNSTGSVTFDQLQTLLSLEPQYLACLIDENGQLQLNEQAMTALANQRLNDAEAQAVQQAITELGQLALQDEKTAVEENATAFSNAINDLSVYNQELATTIAEATVGAAQIRDLNAAINGAETQGASDDQINTVLDNLNTKLQAIDSVREKIASGGIGSVLDTTRAGGGGSSADKWLQEYKDAMSILKDQLDQGLITQTQFYKKSQDLMDKYLKDTPAHVKKYAKEISEAEKDIRNGLTSMFEGIISDLNSDLDNMQSSFSSIANAIEEYNESGALSIDTVQELLKLEPKYLSMLFDENGALQLNQESYERLARAKMEEMKIGLAMEMANTINNLETEAQAIEFVTQMNRELIGSNLSAAESYLQLAVAAAKARSAQTGKAIYSQAADLGLKAYQNQARLIDMTSYSFSSLGGSSTSSRKEEKEEDKEEDKYSKDFEWIERLLERLSKSTEKITKTIEKYISYVKKNNAINRAVKSIDTEVTQSKNAYDFYMTKAREVDLDADTVRKIQNGSIDAETITDEGLGDKIDEYMEWYDKAQDVKDTIDDLFEQQRSLISQKLDNILSYYSDMDSYLSSITSKVESLISLNDQMGKRSSLTELVEQFANLNKQVTSVTTSGETVEIIKQQIASGTAESVKKAIKDANAEEAERLKQEISNLDVTESGTYDKLLKNIAKTEAEIAKYEEKGWDVKKEKKYNKLQKKLENYYALQEALDNNATSNTISNYSKVFNEWQKLMDNTRYQKLLDKESEGTLTKSDQKLLDKYNKKLATYEEKMEKIKNQGQEELDSLANQLSIVNGTTKVTDADKIREKIASIEEDLQNTATYSNLMKKIEDTEAKIAELDAIGYDNLTKKQKSTYDKMLDTLEDYYDRKAALDEGATSENVDSYNKIYAAWKKLQDRLDIGKNLSTDEWKKYNSYLQKLEKWANEKAEQYKSLNAQLETALNPPDKQTAINTEYEDSSEQIYESYQKQIDTIKNSYKNTQTYQDILAKKQKLEKKKDTKGLSKDEERTLNKYNDKLQAFADGATFANITEYMKVWDELYKLQSKLDSGKSLTSDQRKKYDEYTAKLKQWNEEKQSQIDDLTSQMQEELDALNQTYTENVAQAETDMSEYYANLYSLAKQIAEYNITSLEQQLSVIESMVSYYENLVGLYETFSGDKLSSLLVDLEEDATITKLEIYQKQLEALNQQYDVTKSKFKEYQQLLDALDTDNFESSLELFDTILKDDSISQSTKDNLQKVIDLLNERAMDANDWGEYADQWENEWRQALTEAKQDLISIAGSIQNVNDAIRDTSLEPLTDAITQLGYLKDTLSSITNLINDDWIFDDEGNLTEYGNAKVSLLVEQMQNAREEADKYAQQIDAIMSMRDTYSSEDAYQAALQEAKQNYLNSLNELKGFEDSVVSIMTQSNEAIVESLKDVISARINALKAQKELYEYGKNIANSQKEVDNIKAQIDALENLSDATDAATKAKLAQLKADLEEKETALQETKDDHTYNLQIDALDEFMNTLDETMSNAADAVNKSFETYKEAIDSALKVYEENKDYLGEWSDTIMKNILGFANPDGANTINVNVQNSGSDNSTQKPQSFAPIENTITSNKTTDRELIDIKTAIEQGLIVKVDSPLTTINPEMMNFMKGYIPPIANTVCTTLPQIAERKGTQNVINVHYDNLLNVEGN